MTPAAAPPGGHDGRLARAALGAEALLACARMQVVQMALVPSTLVVALVQPVVFVVVILAAMDATGDEAARVVVGVLLMALWGATIWAAGGILRRELWWGTFAASVAGRHHPALLLLGKCAGATVWSAVAITVSVTLAATAMGHPPSVASPGWMLVGFGLAIASATALAMWLSSAFLLTRAAVRISEALMYPVFVLGGILVPLDLLPAGVRWVSVVVSFRWARSVLASAAAGEPVEPAHVAMLVVLTAAYAAAAAYTFDRVLQRARGRGTLEIV